MKRLIIFFIVTILIASNGAIAFADNTNKNSISSKKIVVYLKPDVIVELNNLKLVFYDSQGIVVYPIIYNGSTYLPVRAISGLMKEPIEWDEASKTIFIGKTLSDPNKVNSGVSLSSAAEVNPSEPNRSVIKSKTVNAYLKPDVLVMYNFVLQSFCDANNSQVYPIIYNGTTYLPIRAISELMNEPIEWDGATKTVYIGDGEDNNPQDNTLEEEEEINLVVQNLKMIFEKEELLYYEATSKTTSLKEAKSLEEKQVIAEAISENYISAQNMTIDIKIMDTADYSEKEIKAYKSLIDFAESTEYYILVMENIAYLAAQDTDYSMLAETFLYFALESQTKMEEARKLIQEIK